MIYVPFIDLWERLYTKSGKRGLPIGFHPKPEGIDRDLIPPRVIRSPQPYKVLHSLGILRVIQDPQHLVVPVNTAAIFRRATSFPLVDINHPVEEWGEGKSTKTTHVSPYREFCIILYN